MSFDSSGFGFTLDFDNEIIIFDGGYTVAFNMFDRNGDLCEREDVDFLQMTLPPDSISIIIDLDDLELQHVDHPLH